jgi:SAM-dependent methyltransferase
MYDNVGISPKGRGSVYKTVIEWFSNQKRGKVLDAPAGYGLLSMFFKKMGFEVTCGEIEPEIFQVPDLKCIYVDLNRKIDAGNDTFDYICCVDGLEHMTDPYRAVQEFSRVLKPEGYGIFTIPNYSNIEKRFKFFWFGFLTHPADMEKLIRSGSILFNLHNSPLTITLLDLIFAINGLEVEKIMRNAVKKRQYFFLPVVWLMKLNAMVASEETKKKYRFDLTLKDEVILGGNNLVFITRKRKDNNTPKV